MREEYNFSDGLVKDYSDKFTREEKLKAEKLKQKANKPSFLERYKAIKVENATANTADSLSLDKILPPDQVQK